LYVFVRKGASARLTLLIESDLSLPENGELKIEN
jgi:hypothetical protein